MARPAQQPTGIERHLQGNDVIVSKTDPRGIITYANRTFLDIADYRLDEVIGAPHNLVRHPGMPRVVFKLLWDTLAAGQEIFAYVINQAKNGDHYWVFAHVTPSFDANGKIVGYHSNRRSPRRDALEAIDPVYKLLLAKEQEHSSPKDGMTASGKVLMDFLASKDTTYDRLVLSL